MRDLTALLLTLLPVSPAVAAAPMTPGAWRPGARLAVLPPHYRSLGLTEAQLRRLTDITLWYRPRTEQARANLNAFLKAGAGKVNGVAAVREAARRAGLLAALERLRADELAEKDAVLTQAQRARLKALRGGR